MKPTRVTLSLVSVSLFFATGPGEAQSRVGLLAPGRIQVEGFLSRYRPQAGRVDSRLAGGGGRVLWAIVAPHDSSASGLARRTAVGVFAVAMSAPGAGSVPSASAWHAGAQVDVRPLARPLLGLVEPVVSLGVGAFRQELVERPTWLIRPTLSGLPEVAGAVITRLPPSATLLRPRTEVTTSAAAAPAVGARVRLAPRTSFRADYRDVVMLRDGARRGAELLMGLSVTL